MASQASRAMSTGIGRDGVFSGKGGRFRRDVGPVGLLFASLGSIIGSGWLFGALYASEVAGPAALLSWVMKHPRNWGGSRARRWASGEGRIGSHVKTAEVPA
jgi:hypothetical protein